MKMRSAVCLLFVVVSLGCGSTMHEQDQYGTAGVAAVLNTVAWATAGCRISECNTGWECNEGTGRCERVPCDGRCASRDHCDRELDQCFEPLVPQGGPPASGL